MVDTRNFMRVLCDNLAHKMLEITRVKAGCHLHTDAAVSKRTKMAEIYRQLSWDDIALEVWN